MATTAGYASMVAKGGGGCVAVAIRGGYTHAHAYLRNEQENPLTACRRALQQVGEVRSTHVIGHRAHAHSAPPHRAQGGRLSSRQWRRQQRPRSAERVTLRTRGRDAAGGEIAC